MSMKEMGPGSHQDIIDDHVLAWNWQKIVLFGMSLFDCLTKSLLMKLKHTEEHTTLTATFEEQFIQSWERMIADWDLDQSKPNPYEETTTASIRLELANEEAQSYKNFQMPDTAPSTFIQAGIDIEDQQQSLRWKVQNQKTQSDDAKIQEKRNALALQLEPWLTVQQTYIPTAQNQQENISKYSIKNAPEEFPLSLPSSLAPTSRTTCQHNVANVKRRLRIAQANDALAELCRQIQTTASLRDYKIAQVGPSQKSSTRARSLIERYENKTCRCADRYQTARAALVSLDPGGSWTKRFHLLLKEHIRPPARQADKSESGQVLTWIWAVERRGHVGSGETKDKICQMLRSEWAKSKARADRWSEEVMLVTEEMRCVIQYLDWKAEWWSRQERTSVDQQYLEGIKAYSLKQARIRRQMATLFAAKWHPLHIQNNLKIEWPSRYLPTNSSQSGKPTSTTLSLKTGPTSTV